MNKLYNLSLLGYLMLLPLLGFGQRIGELDRSFNYGRGYNYQFNYGNGADNLVNATALQPDGKILIGGSFEEFNGTPCKRVARLHTDGSIDTSFKIGIGPNNQVKTIAILSDGKIVIGGEFTSISGTSKNYVARLNNNGTLDTGFHTTSIINGVVNTVKIQSDGKLLLGGTFLSNSGFECNRIARLHSNGSLDSSFLTGTGANNEVLTIAIQPDNRILIGGRFSIFNGVATSNFVQLNSNGSVNNTLNLGYTQATTITCISVQPSGQILIGGEFPRPNFYTSNNLIRLNATGLIDSTFNPEIPYFAYFSSIITQPDGKIIIGGKFQYYSSDAYHVISRLNLNGTRDTTFNTTIYAFSAFHIRLNSVILQPDARIVLAGTFPDNSGISMKRLTRINPNGTIDLGFNPSTGANGNVKKIVMQQDGKIIIGGVFTTFNGVRKNTIARLLNDGSLDSSFSANGPSHVGATIPSINSIEVQPNGKILIGGSFHDFNRISKRGIARLNADGSLDEAFNSQNVVYGDVNTVLQQPDGKVIISGTFTGANQNRILRLNSNGSIDYSFNTDDWLRNTINTMCLLPNGQILVAGRLPRSRNSSIIDNLIRINSDGSKDDSFNQAQESIMNIKSIVIQPDGKIILCGSFPSYPYLRNIVRLNQDGNRDLSFNPTREFIVPPNDRAFNLSVNSISLQSNGKIILSGNYLNIQNQRCYFLARLNSNGSLDSNFNTNSYLGFSIETSLPQLDGRILIGGDFTSYNNLSTPGIARVFGEDCSPSTGPTITASGPVDICEGDSVTLTATNGTTYKWSNQASGSSIKVGRSGYYSARSIQNGCTTLHSNVIEVVVNPYPATPIIAASYTNIIGANFSVISVVNVFSNLVYEWSNGEIGNSIIVRNADTISVRARLNNCTSEYSAPIIITGINKLRSKNHFAIYPNPATDKVTIKTNGAGTLEVLNTLGQSVITEIANETNEINISKLAKGIYTVRFNGASQMLVVK